MQLFGGLVGSNAVSAFGDEAQPVLIRSTIPIAVVNASTTYGVDTSAENNYGLGSSYQSTAALAEDEAQQSGRKWTLAAALILFALVMFL